MKERLLLLILAAWCSALSAVAQTENSKEPPVVYSEPLRHAGGNLATVGYSPVIAEKPFLKKVNEPTIALWGDIPGGLPPLPPVKKKGEDSGKRKTKPETEAPSEIPSKDYRLEMAGGKYAAWFGILRASTAADGKQNWTLEHKYFDGLCDAHIQIVSLFGAGDFTAVVPASAGEVPLLSLVRIYGPVTKTAAGTVSISPEFIRVWKKPLFTFMDYGEDHSNPKWVALRKVDTDHIYSPSPNNEFYDLRLGKADAN